MSQDVKLNSLFYQSVLRRRRRRGHRNVHIDDQSEAESEREKRGKKFPTLVGIKLTDSAGF